MESSWSRAKDGVLTRIHDSPRPHLLNPKAAQFSAFVLVNKTATIIVRLVFGFDIAIVDAICLLDTLQEILHLLLAVDRQSAFSITIGQGQSKTHLIPSTDMPGFNDRI
jgi:hypothetical protein